MLGEMNAKDGNEWRAKRSALYTVTDSATNENSLSSYFRVCLRLSEPCHTIYEDDLCAYSGYCEGANASMVSELRITIERVVLTEELGITGTVGRFNETKRTAST